MLGESSAREFLIWIVGISTAAAIIMFGVIYAVDYLVVAPNDSLTTQAIREKGSDGGPARRRATGATVEEAPARYIPTAP
jgi:hypothetical protein